MTNPEQARLSESQTEDTFWQDWAEKFFLAGLDRDYVGLEFARYISSEKKLNPHLWPGGRQEYRQTLTEVLTQVLEDIQTQKADSLPSVSELKETPTDER